MKNFRIICNSLALAGAAMILSMQVSCTNKQATTDKVATTANTTTVPAPAGQQKIAFVNIDSFENHYELLKVKKEAFKARQDKAEGELQASYEQMQNDANAFQQKYQSNSMTQTEAETAQKRLLQMQNSLETRKQSLTEQLMKEQEVLNKELKSRLDSFITDYNKTRHYDFILSHGANGSPLLYANPAFDITNDVIAGMNEWAKSDAAKK